MASNFKIIYAQMCVLAVSSLEATLKLYFENSVNLHENLNRDNKRLKEIKITLSDVLANDLQFGGKLGKLILEKDKPNFQDLKSIKSTFKEYFDKKIILESDVEKKICFYLELRHVLVHKAGVIDNKFCQATNNFNANLKNYNSGDRPELSESDWAEISSAFAELIRATTQPQQRTV